MLSSTSFASLAVLIESLAGCATLPPPVHLEFLNQPEVTRDQTLAQLGPPGSIFEADGVLTYRLGQNKADFYVVREEKQRGWKGVNYDLVLAFDATGLLDQHRLVLIKAPKNAH